MWLPEDGEEDTKYGDLIEEWLHLELYGDTIEHLDNGVVEGAGVVAIVGEHVAVGTNYLVV